MPKVAITYTDVIIAQTVQDGDKYKTKGLCVCLCMEFKCLILPVTKTARRFGNL